MKILNSGVLAFSLLFIWAAFCQQQELIPSAEDPLNVVNFVNVDESGAWSGHTATLAPQEEGVSEFQNIASKPEMVEMNEQPDKIHPSLKGLMFTNAASSEADVLITFKEEIRIPSFPLANFDKPRDDPENLQALAAADRIVEIIQSARLERSKKSLIEAHGGTFVEQFWLVDTIQATIPLSAIQSLAAEESVTYIEPIVLDDLPPQNSNIFDDVADARAIMDTDPYFVFGERTNNGWIGLLDTGVRTTHVLFNSPNRLRLIRDCVNGDPFFCLGGLGARDCWNHGTSSAAILSGNARLGNDYRGVTSILIDSWKVYPECVGLDTVAVLRAFQNAIRNLDWVILAEMQATSGELGSISLAADNAFDAGAVVVAPNGNFGPGSGTVRSPANAHKVLGVGAFDITSRVLYSGSGRGPTADGRIKPDLTAPTNTETASAASDFALQVFTGTSGAGPYATGAAALLRNYLRGTGVIEPGLVYAMMILSGQNQFFNNDIGAGQIQLPTSGGWWYGKTAVRTGTDARFNVNIPTSRYVDFAIWWPESATQIHSDVDLHVYNPSGAFHTASVSVPSVFEKRRVDNPTPGVWQLRVYGFNIPIGTQNVYWAVFYKNP